MNPWVTIQCDTANSCVQLLREPDGDVQLRSSEAPEAIATLSAAEWSYFLSVARNSDGELV